jgi:hypothetical protein
VIFQGLYVSAVCPHVFRSTVVLYVIDVRIFRAPSMCDISSCTRANLTGSYMGTRMARSAVLKEPGVNPFVTILVPMLFHGSLDFYAFFAEAEKTSMPMLGYLTTPVNIVLIGWLLFLCRRCDHGSIVVTILQPSGLHCLLTLCISFIGCLTLIACKIETISKFLPAKAPLTNWKTSTQP